MSEPPILLGLADVDVDGALREAAGRLSTRGQFLRWGARATALGGLVLAAAPESAQARTTNHKRRGRTSAANDDEAILNFALALEYLQASFYTQAEQVGALHGPLAEQARVVGSHERAHVKAFQAVLGRAAIKRPHFDFRGVTDSPHSFRATAVAFEDLATGAYKEQLPLIHSDRYLATAISIHSVEARHAAWIRLLAGVLPAPHAFDEPITDRRTVKLVNSTRFATLHVPRTSAHRSPSFTG